MSRRLLQIFGLLLLLPGASAQTNLSTQLGPEITTIGAVTFENMAALSLEERQQIIGKLHGEDREWVGKQTPESLAAFVESSVLAIYQDRGFWRARISANVVPGKGPGGRRQVDVRIAAMQEGEQYWLKGIAWSGATVFPNNVLLDLMALHPWDLMSRSKVSESLEAVRGLYISKGYVAFSAVPEVEFDDAAHSVSLLINVQEDSPFRFGSLSLEGLDRKASRALQQEWERMREQPYSQESLRMFFEKFLPGMPAGADPLDYSKSNIDLDNHTVDIFVSFLPAQAEKRE